jgi:signal transduction histidine kinase
MLSEPAVCQVRLLVMAIAFVFMQDHPFFQIFFNIFLTIFFVIFTVGQEVYSNRAYFYFQYFNEFFILLIIYHMMVFADVASDIDNLDIMGWSAIVTLTFNMFVNFSYIIASSCKDKIKQIRYRCLIRKRNKLRKELKEREDEDRKEEER